MLTITNGVEVIEVTNGAFQTVFKNQGYKPVKGAKRPAEAVTEPQTANSEGSQGEENTDDAFIAEITEKPIAEWRRDDLIRYAEIKGIEIPEGAKVPEMKEIVKDALDSDDWD